MELGADFLYELLSASSSRLETDYRPGGAGSLPEYQFTVSDQCYMRSPCPFHLSFDIFLIL